MEQNAINDSIERYKLQREKRIKGEIDFIPIYHLLPRFSDVFPGLIRGSNILITANTGVGKSQLAKFMCLLAPYFYNKRISPDKPINYKVLYFALEESVQEIIDSVICALVNIKYNVGLDYNTLNSYKEEPLSDIVLKYIEEVSPLAYEILEHVEIFENITNPTGIYKKCKEVSLRYGIHHEKEINIADDNNNITTKSIYSHYQPFDDTHFVVLIDNLNIVSPERDAPSLEAAMKKWSYDYARRFLTKAWKWTVVNIQQQAAATEEQEFHKNVLNINKVKPTLFGLADNKKTARDMHQVLALFAPERYQIHNYEGYDIKALGDSFRSLMILKNRIGISNVEVPLLFYGDRFLFKELNVK
jgi:hypothetical protein